MLIKSYLFFGKLYHVKDKCINPMGVYIMNKIMNKNEYKNMENKAIIKKYKK